MYNIKLRKMGQNGEIISVPGQVERTHAAPSERWDDEHEDEIKRRWEGRGVDIVVVVHDDPRAAVDCLTAVRDRTPEWIDWRLTVVDNASDEATSGYLREMDWIDQLLRVEEYGGYLPGMWVGARETDGEWVVFLDQHAVPTDGWLESILWAAMEERVAMVEPWTDRLLSLPAGSNHVDMSARLGMGTVSAERPDAFITGRACFAVERRALEEAGGFDVNHYSPGYGEVADIWMRIVSTKRRCVRASRGYVLDRSPGNGAAMDGHRRFMARWGKHAVKFGGAAIGADAEVMKAQAASAISVDTGRPQVVFCFRDLELCGAVLAVTHLSNALVDLGWNSSFAYSRVTPGHSMRHVPARFVPWQFTDGPGFIAGMRKNIRDAWVVATTWFTADDVVKICDGRDDLRPLYFVQDDERLFRDQKGKLYTKPENVENAWKLIERKVANSRWVQRELEEAGHSSERIGIGIDPLTFRPLERPTDRIRVMAHCRPSTPRRGWPFIAAVVSRAARNREFEFVVFDQEYDPNELACPYHGNLGQVSPEELARTMGTVHIFIEGSEVQGWGMQALEAMSCGCAVMSTRNRGVNDYGTNRHDVVLIDHGDVEGAARVLCRLIDDAEARAELGANARATALKFNWESIAKEWSRCLRKLR